MNEVIIQYEHDGNIRTAYFKADTIEEAIISFHRQSSDTILKIEMNRGVGGG